VLEAHRQTDTYQRPGGGHASFPALRNGGILVKTHLKTGAQAHGLLFSSDLTLRYDKLVGYYSLRFQIEFTFRDAKPYWGLADVMNVPSPGHHCRAPLIAGLACPATARQRVGSEGLVARAQICGGNIKIAAGNACAGFINPHCYAHHGFRLYSPARTGA